MFQQTHLVARKAANQQTQAQNRATPTNKQKTQPDLHKPEKKPKKQISGSEPFDLEIWPSL
jgi:hypothetical protein